MTFHVVVSSRSIVGPMREASERRSPAVRRKATVLPFPVSAKCFGTVAEATQWADTYAHESCMSYHRWEVERAGNRYAVAIYSLNTGKRDGWAE